MGTRADFYIGRGKGAEWLGSIAWDGDAGSVLVHNGVATALSKAADADAFKAAVVAEHADKQDFTRPEQGWPWPWEDSRTTDYAYAFDEGQVWMSNFGHRWLTVAEAIAGVDDDVPNKVEFPNMKERQNVTLGERSGVLVFGIPR